MNNDSRIWMQKGSAITGVLEIHKAQYIKAGWKEIAEPEQEPKDEVAKELAKTIDQQKASEARGQLPADNATTQATAQVATELKQPAPTEYDDGLIKPNVIVEPEQQELVQETNGTKTSKNNSKNK